ncbi:MAG: alpha/beta hydrolase [Chloroflexi bacterium]|nr:alpha/beta hydrolase [Chloroflexota bacterium]
MRRWVVPEPSASAEVRAGDGTRILLRRHGNADGPRLVLSHGNGLAVDLYYPFWSLLADRFDLVVYDFRNHGRNPPSPAASHNVATFASDNERVFAGIARHFGPKPWTGVFHSVSAVTILHHDPPGAGASALVLFDPPLVPTSGEPLELDRFWRRFSELVLGRRTRFERRSECAELFRRSRLLAGMVPGGPELAARTLLRPAADGNGFEFRCPPELEARVYEYLFAYSLEFDLDDFPCPVKVIGGDPTSWYSFLPSLSADGVIAFGYDFIPGTTLYLQREKPGECGALLVR